MSQSEQLAPIVASQALFDAYLTGAYGRAAQEELFSSLLPVLDVSNSSVGRDLYKQTRECFVSALTNSDLNVKVPALTFLFSTLASTENENLRKNMLSFLARSTEMMNASNEWQVTTEHKLEKVFEPLDKLLESPGADRLVASVCGFISSANHGDKLSFRYRMAFSIYKWLALRESTLSDEQKNVLSTAVISAFEKKGWQDLIKADAKITIAESRSLAAKKLAPATK